MWFEIPKSEVLLSCRGAASKVVRKQDYGAMCFLPVSKPLSDSLVAFEQED